MSKQKQQFEFHKSILENSIVDDFLCSIILNGINFYETKPSLFSPHNQYIRYICLPLEYRKMIFGTLYVK